MTTRAGRRWAVVAVTAAIAAGCSDMGDRSMAPAQPEPSNRSVVVEIPEFRFSPDPLRIKAGTAVVWHNGHNQAHTSTGAGAMRWNTGNVAPGATSAPVVFPEPGTYPYFCALHPFMKGTVEVSR